MIFSHTIETYNNTGSITLTVYGEGYNFIVLTVIDLQYEPQCIQYRTSLYALKQLLKTKTNVENMIFMPAKTDYLYRKHSVIFNDVLLNINDLELNSILECIEEVQNKLNLYELD